jgi:hypothetical protein
MRFPEFTAGDLLVPFCRSTLKGINSPVGTSALQARIAAENHSYSKNFCKNRVKSLYFKKHHGIFRLSCVLKPSSDSRKQVFSSKQIPLSERLVNRWVTSAAIRHILGIRESGIKLHPTDRHTDSSTQDCHKWLVGGFSTIQ